MRFLLQATNRLSGLEVGAGELEAAVREPIVRACFVLSREFGWTPEQCSELTLGQVLLYLEMLARGETPERRGDAGRRTAACRAAGARRARSPARCSALRDGEPAIAALTANPAAPLADIAAIAWAFEAPDGKAAIAQSLARLRGTDAGSAPRSSSRAAIGSGPAI